MQWWGRPTNAPTDAYYRSVGAGIPSVLGEDIAVYRLTGAPLADLAARA
ncbi:hypothetical protein Daura_38755 [Dactylosporangium aurantiacum]|uniref:Uncharacterized protein n=1 Tax=Dactylosporangium aurantiacum TaxID=35754 RepID=A0A9Q9MB55_9ACTN|nr:hypothetical protein [Dactylosporangium aurantiacum]MDG6101637.1 hypothetical protein [Dactylosporangium aurantiacum]UWZ52538.1 hypothetical protein Daura_38755 [Dactylosporangium aurantiacum]